MLQRKKEAIRREEANFERTIASEVKQIKDLEEKERILIDTLQDKEIPVSQMLHDYFTFKYERFQRKIDSEIRSNILGEKIEL